MAKMVTLREGLCDGLLNYSLPCGFGKCKQILGILLPRTGREGWRHGPSPMVGQGGCPTIAEDKPDLRHQRRRRTRILLEHGIGVVFAVVAVSRCLTMASYFTNLLL